MSVILRALELRDIPKVLGLFSKLSSEMVAVPFSDVISERQIEVWLDHPDTYVYVAADGDLILAVIRAKRGADNKAHGASIALACDESFGGHKYMELLTNYCGNELRAQGVSLMRAYVFSNNAAAIQTVLNCGFVLSGAVHKHHYDESGERFVDDLIFYKELEL